MRKQCAVFLQIVNSKYTLIMLILTGVDKYDIKTISNDEVLNNFFTMYVRVVHKQHY
jgi:hypothetical protein